MALINCPECNKQVSDRAASCPSCGVGIASASETHAAGQPLTTVQQTSKKFKLQIALSLLLGAFGLMVSLSSPESQAGYIMIGIAAVWFLITRIRTWWHHD